MEHYVKRKKPRKFKVIASLLSVIITVNSFLIFYDRKILPSVLEISTIMAKNQTMNIINEKSIAVLNDNFNYHDMVDIQKDDSGSITLVQADTAKLNNIAAQLAMECNKGLEQMKDTPVKVPLGWTTNRSLFFRFGPDINMYIMPIGNITTEYESKFESAGLNQTRHKIYINVTAQVRLKLPVKVEDVTVSTQIPVSDTIIVGKVPQMTWGINNNSDNN